MPRILLFLAPIVGLVGCDDDPPKDEDLNEEVPDNEGASGEGSGSGAEGAGSTGSGSGSGTTDPDEESGTVDGTGSGPDDPTTTTVTTIEELVAVGTAGFFMEENACAVLWDLQGEGSDCDDCALAFEIDLSLVEDSCGGATDIAGSLEFRAGATYFERFYWGSYDFSGGMITWATAGYVAGPGGDNYYYVGIISY
jgi:hypothetical protein